MSTRILLKRTDLSYCVQEKGLSEVESKKRGKERKWKHYGIISNKSDRRGETHVHQKLQNLSQGNSRLK